MVIGMTAPPFAFILALLLVLYVSAPTQAEEHPMMSMSAGDTR
jgi:hypothetical protein